VKIGDFDLDGRTALAPMRAVNCPSFRILCKQHGAALVYTQVFWSWEAEKWQDRLETEFSGRDGPLVVQVGGNQPDQLRATVEKLEPWADIIDFNASCPYNEVCGNKSGSFLLLHANQLERAVKAVLAATNKTVTAKIRIGWKPDSINVLETVKLLQDLGVQSIAIHGRTRSQGFRGTADWSWIQKAKEIATVPIIGNGDVNSGSSAEKMIETTGCDAVMIGRAAQGNPFIFAQVNAWLDSHKLLPQDFDQKCKDFLEFVRLYHEIEQDRSFSEVKDHAMWYLKGRMIPGKVKDSVRDARTISDLERAFMQ
jgi:nifR3 family TIM-barrel protein